MPRTDKDLFGKIENISARTDDLSPYLKLAYRSIIIADKPLKAIEMLNIAEDFGFLPDHLFGRTQHKTLNARLSEHILKEGLASLFFRTAPGTYFLSDIAENLPSDENYRVFHGNRRSKTIRNEAVLVCDRVKLKEQFGQGFREYDEQKFVEAYDNLLYFKDRVSAEADDTIKQFVTFTIFHHKHLILIHRRGKYSTASENLKGAYSVGFGGHVNSDDFDLFHTGGRALINNAGRELWEELYLQTSYRSIDEIKRRTQIKSYINVDDTDDAQHHIAVLVAVQHKSNILPTKGELSINELQWLDTKTPHNDLSKFDLWSQMILENIYNGSISLKRDENVRRH